MPSRPTIDICTTAIRRPEILEKTFSSFKANMLKDADGWLYLNIDPLGDADNESVIQTASKYFPFAHINVGDTPNCTNAWQWCWQNTISDVVLWLEDDWELLKPIDLQGIMDIFEAHPDVGGIRLPKRDLTNEFYIGKVGSNRYAAPYREDVGAFEIYDGKSAYAITGNPCFYRGGLLRKLAPLLDINNARHPEKYLRYCPQAHPIINSYRYLVYGKPNETAYVKDIGYGWRAEAGYVKKSNGRGWKK